MRVWVRARMRMMVRMRMRTRMRMMVRMGTRMRMRVRVRMRRRLVMRMRHRLGRWSRAIFQPNEKLIILIGTDLEDRCNRRLMMVVAGR
jgi:hypothetical protein